MTNSSTGSWKRFLPLAILLTLMLIAYVTGLGDYLSLENIRQHRQALLSFVSTYPVRAPAAYIVVYIAATALSVPGAVFLTLLGGFLFPQPLATVYVVFSATIGAIIIFLVAKTALGSSLRDRAGSTLQSMQAGFQENAVSYLFFLRLVPAFPFWMVNLAPAFFGVTLFTFSWTTLLGIIPGSFVFTQAGAGLGAILDSGEGLTVANILNNDVKLAFVALGIFALIPVVVRRYRTKISKESTDD